MQPPLIDSTRTSIAQVRARFLLCFDDHDAHGLANCYWQDGRFFPPGFHSIQGQPAIQAFWQGVFDMGIGGLEHQPQEMTDYGAFVYEAGAYHLRADGETLDQGSYIVIWKQSHGQWKRHRELWNSIISC